MDEVAFPFEEFVDGVADVPCDLVLPQTVRHTLDSGNLNRHVDSSMKNSTTYRCSPAENPPISAITIFGAMPTDEFLDFTGDAWPPASAPGTRGAGQQCVRRNQIGRIVSAHDGSTSLAFAAKRRR